MRYGTLRTITHTVDANLEIQIAAVVVTTTALAAAGQKNRLRKAFAELAVLKSRRTAIVIHRLDLERGLVYLP